MEFPLALEAVVAVVAFSLSLIVRYDTTHLMFGIYTVMQRYDLTAYVWYGMTWLDKLGYEMT